MQPNIPRILFLALLLGTALSLSLGVRAEEPAISVQTHGSLRAMMHEGALEATVSLDSLLPDPQLYAVGALAQLAGEITVLGGRAYLTYPEADGETRIEVADRTDALLDDAGAALLVAARVEDWQSLTLAEAIPFEELGEEVRRLATEAGLDVEHPFPFLVEGELLDLEWHVIDGSRLPEGPSSHQAHRSAGVRSSLHQTSGTLLGFYSSKHQGVFTHMGSTTHVHCVLTEPLATGHVDHVTLAAGAQLRLPAPGSSSKAPAAD